MNIQDAAHRARIALSRLSVSDVATAAAELAPYPEASELRDQVERLLEAIVTARAAARALADFPPRKERAA